MHNFKLWSINYAIFSCFINRLHSFIISLAVIAEHTWNRQSLPEFLLKSSSTSEWFDLTLILIILNNSSTGVRCGQYEGK